MPDKKDFFFKFYHETEGENAWHIYMSKYSYSKSVKECDFSMTHFYHTNMFSTLKHFAFHIHFYKLSVRSVHE